MIDTFVPRAELLTVFAPQVALILEQLAQYPTTVTELAALTGLSKTRTSRICEQLFQAERIVRAEKWGPWTLTTRSRLALMTPPGIAPSPQSSAVSPPPAVAPARVTTDPPPPRTVIAEGEEFEVTYSGADFLSGYQSRGGSSLSAGVFSGSSDTSGETPSIRGVVERASQRPLAKR